MEILRNRILEAVKARPKCTFVDLVRNFTDFERSAIHEQLSLMTQTGILKKSMDRGVACYETA